MSRGVRCQGLCEVEMRACGILLLGFLKNLRIQCAVDFHRYEVQYRPGLPSCVKDLELRWILQSPEGLPIGILQPLYGRSSLPQDGRLFLQKLAIGPDPPARLRTISIYLHHRRLNITQLLFAGRDKRVLWIADVLQHIDEVDLERCLCRASRSCRQIL